MREKVFKALVTFHTTTGAIAMEKRCKALKIPGRLIPVPTSITAGCGMAWCMPIEAKDKFMDASAGTDVEGYYEMMI